MEDDRRQGSASREGGGVAQLQVQLAERLYEAKMRRWNNGFKRTNKMSPFGQMERYYKAKLELAGACRKHLQTQLDTANAMAVCSDALLRVRERCTDCSHVPWPHVMQG